MTQRPIPNKKPTDIHNEWAPLAFPWCEIVLWTAPTDGSAVTKKHPHAFLINLSSLKASKSLYASDRHSLDTARGQWTRSWWTNQCRLDSLPSQIYHYVLNLNVKTFIVLKTGSETAITSTSDYTRLNVMLALQFTIQHEWEVLKDQLQDLSGHLLHRKQPKVTKRHDKRDLGYDAALVCKRSFKSNKVLK